jgi:hypothetical protein
MQLRYLMITQTNGIWLRQCLSASRSSPPPTIWRVTLKFRARDLTIRRPAECRISKIRLSWRFHRENDLGNPSFRASEANTSHRALQPSFVTTSQILGDTLTYITCATECDQIDPAVRNMNQCSSIGLAVPANPRGDEGKSEGLRGEELFACLVRHFESASRKGIRSRE